MIAPDLAAEALFCSPLQPSRNPSRAQVDKAITAAVLAFGADGCAAHVAQEFGDHPEMAVARMRWCRDVVDPAKVPAPV